jgi:hypothetical protein
MEPGRPSSWATTRTGPTVAGDGAVDFESLTPTQQLVLEVLAARHRLGHTTWTFTETGKKLMLDPHYRPPSNGGRR